MTTGTTVKSNWFLRDLIRWLEMCGDVRLDKKHKVIHHGNQAAADFLEWLDENNDPRLLDQGFIRAAADCALSQYDAVCTEARSVN